MVIKENAFVLKDFSLLIKFVDVLVSIVSLQELGIHLYLSVFVLLVSGTMVTIV